MKRFPMLITGLVASPLSDVTPFSRWRTPVSQSGVRLRNRPSRPPECARRPRQRRDANTDLRWGCCERKGSMCASWFQGPSGWFWTNVNNGCPKPDLPTLRSMSAPIMCQAGDLESLNHEESYRCSRPKCAHGLVTIE